MSSHGWVPRSLAALVIAATLGCVSRPAIPDAPPAVAAVQTTPPSLTAAPDEFFTSADVRIRFRDIGRGQPVVLIHGLTRSLDDWVGLGDSLARDHRVIALDVRGFGRSTRVTDRSRLGVEMANDVIRLLDHLGISSAHLAGHSMGALIAANIAANHPERVSGVSLIAGPFYEEAGAFAKDEAGFAADVERGAGISRLIKWFFPNMPDSAVAAENAAAMRANNPATVAAAMRSMDALTIRPSATGVARVPALIIVGSADPLAPQSRWIASWWPRARLVEVPNADHLSILYTPQVLAAMRSLMREQRAALLRGQGLKAATAMAPQPRFKGLSG